MSVLTIDSVDDQVLTTGSLSFTGQVSAQKPNRIADSELALMENVDIGPDGMLRMRPAARRMHTAPLSILGGPMGFCYFDVPGIECVIVKTPYLLHRIDLAGNVTPFFGGTYTETGKAYFAQLINVLYLADDQAGLRYCFPTNADGSTWTEGWLRYFKEVGGIAHPLPVISYCCAHRGRLVIVPKNTDVLYVSSILGTVASGGTLVEFDAVNGIRVGSGEGDPIVAVVPGKGMDLIVLKETSIWTVYANPLQSPAEWEIKQITAQYGCVGPRAWCWVGNDIWLYSQAGIVSIKRVIAGEEQEVSPVFSQPIDDVLKRVNKTVSQWISAVCYEDKVAFTLPLDGPNLPAHILSYNLTTKAWQGLWGLWADAMGITRFGGVIRWAVATANHISHFDWGHTSDLVAVAEEAIISRIVTKSYNWGDFIQKKSPESVAIECHDTTARLSIYASIDGEITSGVYDLKTIAEDQIMQRLPVFPLVFPLRFTYTLTVRRAWDLLWRDDMRECQSIQFHLVFTGGDFNLRELIVNAFINTYDIEK